MVRRSERQMAIRHLERILPTLRHRALTASVRCRIRTALLYMLFFDDLLDGDPLILQMYRLSQSSRVSTASLLEGIEGYLSRIQHHRYFDERGSWRGLRQDRLSHLDWLRKGMDENWFISQVRVNRKVFKHNLRQIRHDPVFQNQAYYKQYEPKYQLMVALYRFGHFGNSCSVKEAAKLFHIAEGTVVLWTGRVIIALLSQQAQWIRWPSTEERKAIKTQIGQRSPFCHCVGYADDSLLHMENKPTGPDWYDYHSRKEAYSLNALFVCDDDNRITFMKLGWGGSTHDVSVYRDTPLHHRSAEFMSTDEYLLADSGYITLHSDKVITSYKPNAPGGIERADRLKFNKEVAKVRITIEHTIGMLKSRWQCLRGLRHLIRDHQTFTNMIYWVRACAVLHNMLVGLPADDFWEGEDVRGLIIQCSPGLRP